MRRADGDWYDGQLAGESGVLTWAQGRVEDRAGRPASATDAACAGPATEQGHASWRRSVHVVYGTFAGHKRKLDYILLATLHDAVQFVK